MVYLLAFGLLFPFLSFLTAITSAWAWWRHGRHESPLFIPFVGPVSLSVFGLVNHLSLWLIPIFWLTDLGTLYFLYATPRLLREWWETSAWTNCLTLYGDCEPDTATLTLHKTGHYLLKTKRDLQPPRPGMIASSEVGTWLESDKGFELTAHYGRRRTLRRLDVKDPTPSYSVQESPRPDDRADRISLDGWTMTARTP